LQRREGRAEGRSTDDLKPREVNALVAGRSAQRRAAPPGNVCKAWQAAIG
jgi:hypothetical protein